MSDNYLEVERGGGEFNLEEVCWIGSVGWVVVVWG